jgi:threonine/homoserine/homoserine lactone efflux protein
MTIFPASQTDPPPALPESPSPIPTWVWVLGAGVLAWGAWGALSALGDARAGYTPRRYATRR